MAAKNAADSMTRIATRSARFAALHLASAAFLKDDDRPQNGGSGAGGEGEGSRARNWSSLIGIITAICGNVLIALALNVQRYAHIRLHKRRALVSVRAKQTVKRPAIGSAGGQRAEDTYGAAENDDRAGRIDGTSEAEETDSLARYRSIIGEDSDDQDSALDEGQVKAPSSYLKDAYWWLGQVLITVGEMGNFLAYGFAPASIVSPLGVVALVSNCVIAPIFFGESFRLRDFWGVIIAVAGAVTVVLSAKTEETKLEPHDVWKAMTTTEFEMYLGVSCGLIVLLMWMSPMHGSRTIVIDLGLVGLFGGYTALATKGVSSMLSSTLLRAFTTPVTYVLLFVLLATAVLQVRYVNKALQRFDSTQVIPIQFVLFTLSVIIGSAVLYRDFQRTTAEQAAKFVGGCLLTFFGVFLITSGRPPCDDEETSDVEGMETISLAAQEPASPQTPQQQDASSRRASDSARSRRSSSRAPHFTDAMNRPVSLLADKDICPLRMPAGSKASLASIYAEDSPLLIDSTPQTQVGFLSQLPFSESLRSVTTAAVSVDVPHQMPSTHHAPPPALPAINIGPPWPSTLSSQPYSSSSLSRLHNHHYGGTLICPSPFASTVSAVVLDKRLVNDSANSVRRLASRRSRPGLRGSLYAVVAPPQNDCEAEEADTHVEGRDIHQHLRRAHTHQLHQHPRFACLARGGDAVPDGHNNRADGNGPVPGKNSNKTFRVQARSLSQTLLGGFFSSASPSASGLSRPHAAVGKGEKRKKAVAVTGKWARRKRSCSYLEDPMGTVGERPELGPAARTTTEQTSREVDSSSVDSPLFDLI